MSDLKFLKKLVKEAVTREKYGLLTEISDDDTKVIRGPTSNRSSGENSGEYPPESDKVERLSREEFIKRFDNVFAPNNLSFDKFVTKALLKFLNEKRVKTGTSDDSEVDRLFDDFRNSDFAQQHLQSYVTEEED